MSIFLGFIVGPILAITALAKNLLLIAGSYLLCASVVINPSEPPAWNQTKLIIGLVFLLIGLVATRWSIQKSN